LWTNVEGVNYYKVGFTGEKRLPTNYSKSLYKFNMDYNN
jgi:hypothetical protein